MKEFFFYHLLFFDFFILIEIKETIFLTFLLYIFIVFLLKTDMGLPLEIIPFKLPANRA